jgi:hypothetical protein
MVRWLVTDISKFVQFPDALVIGSYRGNAAVSHQRFAIYGDRVFKAVPLPAHEQASEQADMRGQHSAVSGHSPDPPAKGGSLLIPYCGIHGCPPSNSLVMSSNL